MVRELANYDPTKYAQVFKYPLAEALLSYEQRLQDDARREFELRCLIYAIQNSYGKTKSKPPELPAILKD